MTRLSVPRVRPKEKIAGLFINGNEGEQAALFVDRNPPAVLIPI